jgi:hypothetical protein
MTNLSLKHSHLMVECQVVSLCRRPDDNTPEQTPDNRLQEIKHCRRIVAQSIKRSRPKGRMRFLVGTTGVAQKFHDYVVGFHIFVRLGDLLGQLVDSEFHNEVDFLDILSSHAIGLM